MSRSKTDPETQVVREDIIQRRKVDVISEVAVAVQPIGGQVVVVAAVLQAEAGQGLRLAVLLLRKLSSVPVTPTVSFHAIT